LVSGTRRFSRILPELLLPITDYCGWEAKSSLKGPIIIGLRAIKKKYDPTGLFFVHHGVGSEEWSADGFTRKS
jgi:hypothetical protein